MLYDILARQMDGNTQFITQNKESCKCITLNTHDWVEGLLYMLKQNIDLHQLSNVWKILWLVGSQIISTVQLQLGS